MDLGVRLLKPNFPAYESADLAERIANKKLDRINTLAKEQELYSYLMVRVGTEQVFPALTYLCIRVES